MRKELIAALKVIMDMAGQYLRPINFYDSKKRVYVKYLMRCPDSTAGEEAIELLKKFKERHQFDIIIEKGK